MTVVVDTSDSGGMNCVREVDVLGSDPSTVYQIVAPGVGVVRLTFRVVANSVPDTGLATGGSVPPCSV